MPEGILFSFCCCERSIFLTSSDVMPKVLSVQIAAFLMLGFNALAARCNGSPNCDVCTSCKACAHCAKQGGTCGVCKPSASSLTATSAPPLSESVTSAPTDKDSDPPSPDSAPLHPESATVPPEKRSRIWWVSWMGLYIGIAVVFLGWQRFQNKRRSKKPEA